jgi:glycosyltransferase involved in cell wall biosynthesis
MIEIIHKSSVISPKASIIFFDRPYRGDLHSLDYLAKQIVPREQYEIIFIEYYSRRTDEIARRLDKARTEGKPDPVDQWIIMGMPEDLYYHKHLMCNVGLAASRGEIIMIGDSDAMFRPTFIQSMLETFDLNSKIVLHYDEVRNSSRDFYPFNYPSFDEVIGEGAVNWQDGTTTGLLDFDNPLHSLNYGAAFCARRKDLIRIGGADEHDDYVGHVGSPYELSFRLENFGCEMVWHGAEFLYRTWHPDQERGANLVGPYDGARVSIRALKAKETGRVFPWRGNQAIRRLGIDGDLSFDLLVEDLVIPEYLTSLKLGRVKASDQTKSERRICGLFASDKAETLAPLRHDGLQPLGQIQGEADIEILPVEFVETIGRWNILGFQGRYYGVPHELSAVDLAGNTSHRNDKRIIKSESLESLQAMLREWARSTPVEFIGWLPVFKQFGNCGSHPQFLHIDRPPLGYQFCESGPARNSLLDAGRVLLMLRKLAKAAIKIGSASVAQGVSLLAVWKFLKSRGLKGQFTLPLHARLVFLPSVPYTLGQDNWVIEIEDTTSLMFPFVHNGQTVENGPDGKPVIAILKAMLTSNSCKGIITHVKSTADSIPVLFGNEKLKEKVTYAPLGIQPKPIFSRSRQRKTRVDLLFTNSWHQNVDSFFIRGGLDVLEAFAILREKYSHIYLTLRTGLPCLEERYHEIIRGGRVRVLDQFLTRDSWCQLIRQSDVYMLPSDRIHVVSMLEAMAFGTVLVTSDGWGIEEYVRHNENGIVIPGRYGKVTWIEKESGILRENYALMRQPDREVINRIVAEISELIEDPEKMYKIQMAARRSVAEEFNVDRWNQGLKAALDKATA